MRATLAARSEGLVVISHREGDEAIATRVVDLDGGRGRRDWGRRGA